MMTMIREIEDGVKERADFLRQKSQRKSVEQNVFILILKSIFGAQTKMYLLDLTDTFGVIFCHIQSFGFKQIASPSF